MPSRPEIEELFPATRNLIYLDTAYRGPLCKPAREAAEVYLHNISERGSLEIQRYIDLMHGCRKRLASVFNARPEEFVFLANATDAFSRVTLGIDWREGDEVVAPENDYPGVLRPLLDLRRRGVKLVLVPPDEGGLIARPVLDACGPRTRLIAASHVNFRTGGLLEARTFAHGAKNRGVLSAIDFVQSAGCLEIDLAEIGCDFGTFAARKWFCALDTLGVLFVREESLNKLTPHTLGLFSVAEPHNFDALEQPLALGARRFMLGAPPYIQIAAFDASLQLYQKIGPKDVQKQVLNLQFYMHKHKSPFIHDALEVDGMRCLRPKLRWSPELVETGIRCIKREGHLLDPSLPAWLLDRGLVVSVRGNFIRVSPHWFNTESDIDRLFDALATFGLRKQ